MGCLLNVVTPLHQRTARDYVARMTDYKVHCMEVAKKYGQEYWDGARRYGFGGYRYDGRQRAIAKRLVDVYSLPPDARILDVGCGKGFLLYELSQLLPQATVAGFDLSEYAGFTESQQDCEHYEKFHFDLLVLSLSHSIVAVLLLPTIFDPQSPACCVVDSFWRVSSLRVM